MNCLHLYSDRKWHVCSYFPSVLFFFLLCLILGFYSSILFYVLSSSAVLHGLDLFYFIVTFMLDPKFISRSILVTTMRNLNFMKERNPFMD